MLTGDEVGQIGQDGGGDSPRLDAKPLLLERRIEHGSLAAERGDAKVPSSIASHEPPEASTLPPTALWG